MAEIEQGFRNFSDIEVRKGFERGVAKYSTIEMGVLRRLANDTGALRAQNANASVGELAELAVRNYEHRNHTRFAARKTDVLISTIGWMFGERNPVVKAKRLHDAEVARLVEVQEAEESSSLDSRVQLELFQATKADA
jgi:hypothetical protein